VNQIFYLFFDSLIFIDLHKVVTLHKCSGTIHNDFGMELNLTDAINSNAWTICNIKIINAQLAYLTYKNVRDKLQQIWQYGSTKFV
jgi:hypothetical protein